MVSHSRIGEFRSKSQMVINRLSLARRARSRAFSLSRLAVSGSQGTRLRGPCRAARRYIARISERCKCLLMASQFHHILLSQSSLLLDFQLRLLTHIPAFFLDVSDPFLLAVVIRALTTDNQFPHLFDLRICFASQRVSWQLQRLSTAKSTKQHFCH